MKTTQELKAEVRRLTTSPGPFRKWLKQLGPNSPAGWPHDMDWNPITRFLRAKLKTPVRVDRDKIQIYNSATGRWIRAKIPDWLFRFLLTIYYDRPVGISITVEDCLQILNQLESPSE